MRFFFWGGGGGRQIRGRQPGSAWTHALNQMATTCPVLGYKHGAPPVPRPLAAPPMRSHQVTKAMDTCTALTDGACFCSTSQTCKGPGADAISSNSSCGLMAAAHPRGVVLLLLLWEGAAAAAGRVPMAPFGGYESAWAKSMSPAARAAAAHTRAVALLWRRERRHRPPCAVWLAMKTAAAGRRPQPGFLLVILLVSYIVHDQWPRLHCGRSRWQLPACAVHKKARTMRAHKQSVCNGDVQTNVSVRRSRPLGLHSAVGWLRSNSWCPAHK